MYPTHCPASRYTSKPGGLPVGLYAYKLETKPWLVIRPDPTRLLDCGAAGDVTEDEKVAEFELPEDIAKALGTSPDVIYGLPTSGRMI